jgi:hypothetical protein
VNDKDLARERQPDIAISDTERAGSVGQHLDTVGANYASNHIHTNSDCAHITAQSALPCHAEDMMSFINSEPDD